MPAVPPLASAATAAGGVRRDLEGGDWKQDARNGGNEWNHAYSALRAIFGFDEWAYLEKERNMRCRCNSIVRMICLLAMGAMILRGGAHATPPQTNDSAGRANEKANTGSVRAVTGDSARINTVVAGSPPSATISIVPVPAKVGSYPVGTTIVGNELRLHAGGIRAWFEIRLFGWDTDHDNIPSLGGFQAAIDAGGYLGANADPPNSGVDLAPPVIACPGGNPAPCTSAFGESWAKCRNSVCMAGNVDRAGTGRPDSWCAPSGGGCAGGDVDTSFLSYRWFLASDSTTGHPDQPLTCEGGTRSGQGCSTGAQCSGGGTCTGPGLAFYYAGSLVLDVPSGAEGKYTVNLNTDETFLFDSASPPNDIPTLLETGFVVNIGQPPPPKIVWNPSAASPLRGSRSLTIGMAPPSSATASGTSEPRAIKVTMVDLQNVVPPNLPLYPPQDFHLYEVATCNNEGLPGTGECLQPPGPCAGSQGNCARWVGKPITFLEAQDQVLGDNFKAARLQCTPYYTDWVAETKDGSTIAIFGAEVLPSSEYIVETYDLSCLGIEDTCTDVETPGVCSTMKCSGLPVNTTCTGSGQGTCPAGQICDFVKKCSGLPADTVCVGTGQGSCDPGQTCDYFVSCEVDAECAALSAGTCVVMVMSTRRLGDVSVDYQVQDPDAPLSQPNAIDVTVMVNKFKSLPGSPSKGQLQLQPNTAELNGDVNALDILAVVDAFKGRAYSFGGPCPCPSQADCEALECASATVCTASALPGLGPQAVCVKTCRAPATNVGDPCVKHSHCPGGFCGEVLKCAGGPNAGLGCATDTNCPMSTCGWGYCRDRCARCTP